MEDFELLRHVTIGQYLPTGSLLHRLDPRSKIVGFGLLVLAVAIYAPSGGHPPVAGLLFALVLSLSLLALARIRLGFALGGLRPALPILAFLALLQLAFGWGVAADSACRDLFAGWILHVSNCSIYAVVALLARLTALILLTSLLTLTSATSELTHGVEALLRPFQRLGVPAHELALSFTLALRFVPTLAEELEKLLKAQAARGADIRLGANPVRRTRSLLPVIVPLFLNALRRSEELVEAMLARGYSGGRGRSHYVRLHFTAIDIGTLVCVMAFVAALFIAPFPAVDRAWLRLLAR